jgi:hypothetical protein
MTLKKMAEQILLRYKASRPTQDTDLDERELYDLIIKAINAAIKLEHFNVNLPQSERYVPNAGLATYEVAVQSETGGISAQGQCVLFGAQGGVFGWSTPSDQGWATEGDEGWAVDGFGGVTVTVTENNGTYTVLIAGFVLPANRTAKQLELFLSAGNMNSYIQFAGFEAPAPSIFAYAGMRNIVVSDNTLKFTYSISLANTIDPELLPIVGETHDIITAGSYQMLLSDIKRCDNKITDSRGRARITLPAQPIALPRGMGIWQIGDYRDINSAYIPIQAGEHNLLRGTSHTGLSDAMGRLIAYEWYHNNTVYFNKKASELPEKVLVRLVVVDPDTISEYEQLPIPADMEEAVIIRVMDILKADGQPDLKTDKLP